jgi:dihydropyrimidinase
MHRRSGGPSGAEAGAFLVRGGTLVTPQGTWRADVRSRGGRIVEVGPGLEADGEPVLDAGGALVFPGIIDPHLHFALVAAPHRTADDFASGSASSLAGGVTTFIDFAHQHAGENLADALDARLQEAAGSRADYSLHVIVTDVSGRQLEELPALTARGFTSAKVYTTYRPAGFFCDDYTILQLMRAAASAGWIIMIHCENDAIVEGTRSRFVQEGKVAFAYHARSRPAVAEVETVQRVILLSREAGCPIYPVHLSAGESPRLIAQARASGLPVVGETCPQFLVEDESVYATERAARFIHTPPLRSKEDQRSLWEALCHNGLQTVASDHCGYTLRQRTDYGDITRVAPGIPGTETLLPLLYTHGVGAGRLELPDLAKICCENPARTFGLYPRKGAVAEGADADLVIYDPGARWTIRDEWIHSAAGYSPYDGMNVEGRVVTTVLRGEVAYDGKDVIAAQGRGRLIPRAPVRKGDLP